VYLVVFACTQTRYSTRENKINIFKEQTKHVVRNKGMMWHNLNETSKSVYYIKSKAVKTPLTHFVHLMMASKIETCDVNQNEETSKPRGFWLSCTRTDKKQKSIQVISQADFYFISR
jgi:hypothetical protein